MSKSFQRTKNPTCFSGGSVNCSTRSKSQVIGQDKPCEVRQGAEVVDRLPNIPTQAGLTTFDPATDLIQISNPDDFTECYQKINTILRQLRSQEPTANLCADYTGGTKTMSVALAIAALDNNIPLYLTTAAERANLIKIERNETTGRVGTTAITVERRLQELFPKLLEQYNYAAIVAEIKTMLTTFELPPDIQKRLRSYLECCLAFDAWDRFDHRVAWHSIERYMGRRDLEPHGLFLKKILASRSSIDLEFSGKDGIKGHGYEIVEDLLLNAQRRAIQERYDDAVGRLYRALELLAQIRLYTQYGLATGNIDLAKLPESLQSKYQQNPRNDKKAIQLGLDRSYELLADLADSPLGATYQQERSHLLNALVTRNQSLFAHGFQSINRPAYQQVSDTIGGFIQGAIAKLDTSKKKSLFLQLPTTLNW